MTKLQTRKRNDMTIFNGWTLIELPTKQLNINPLDIETSDAQREDGKMTSEDSTMMLLLLLIIINGYVIYS
jgi:hypothetical protein